MTVLPTDVAAIQHCAREVERWTAASFKDLQNKDG